MPVSKEVFKQLVKMIGRKDALTFARLAVKVDAVERKHTRAVQDAIESALLESLPNLIDGRRPETPDFEELIMAAWIDVVITETSPKHSPHRRMAKGGKGLTDLKKIWDQWMNHRKAPKRQKKIAKDLKKIYQKAVKSWWLDASDAFRTGKTYDMDKAKQDLVKKVKMPVARAQTVIRTETTAYQNQARRAFYDQAPGITHYLYMAIRDSATTAWCRTRHGMVNEKGTKLCDENTPPVHWNCRSEILPLDPDNPSHLQMINDKSRKPANRTLAPLPKEFKRP